MQKERKENNLRIHRKRTGLKQREMGKLLGYKDPGHVARHERAEVNPPLKAALAYEVIFRVPVATIFVGAHEAVRREVERRLQELEEELGNRNAKDRDSNLTAQKLIWLNGRKSQ